MGLLGWSATLICACGDWGLGESEVDQNSMSLMQVEVRRGNEVLAHVCGIKQYQAAEELPVGAVTFQARQGDIVNIEHRSMTVLKRRDGRSLGVGDAYWCSDEDGVPGFDGYAGDPHVIQCLRQVAGEDVAGIAGTRPILSSPSPYDGDVDALGYALTLEVLGSGTAHYAYDPPCMVALGQEGLTSGTVPHTIELVP